jgi:hypothetical protein
MKCSRVSLTLQVFWTIAGLFFVPSAHAWGCKGHQTVALMAEKHLTPAAKQMLLTLLKDNPIDPALKRYCGNAMGDEFADASTWPDDIRNLRKETQPWHYLDIPRGAQTGPVGPFCGENGCVTQAIEQQLGVLKDKTAASAKRADALRFLIHFVGDLHQPLHATTNGDRGGNCVPVKYFRRNPHVRFGSYSPNLHHIWDTEILERQAEGADPAEISDALEAAFAGEIPGWQRAGIHLEDWAWESHDHAEETTYGALAKKIPIEKDVPVNACTDNNQIGDRMQHKHIAIGQAYQDEAASVVDERLAQAGIRLAMILNEAAK